MNRRPHSDEEAEINNPPMRDIVFIMLIFFIVTTSFVKEQGLEVSRPSNAPPKEVKQHKGNFTSKKTTNAFGKSDQESCQWAFLSAIKSLHQRALSEGANAVINIQSITTGESVSDQAEFVCRAGNVVSKVYLKGVVVVL